MESIVKRQIQVEPSSKETNVLYATCMPSLGLVCQSQQTETKKCAMTNQQGLLLATGNTTSMFIIVIKFA